MRSDAQEAAGLPRGDDKRVYDAYIAGRQSAAMAVAVRAGLFDLLAQAERDDSGDADFRGLSRSAIQSEMNWSERGTRSMLGALHAIGLLQKAPEGFRATAEAIRSLTRDTPGSLRGLIDMEVDHFLSPKALWDSLQEDNATIYGGEDPWEAHGKDPAKARAFTEAMHSVSERPAAGFADHVELAETQRLLDVGGGSGALSIAVARANPKLECVVWDIAAVCPLAEEYVAKADLSDRVTAEVGDMFAAAYPDGYDAILFSQILHDWSYETGAELLARAFAALPSGGQVLVHEKLIEDEDSDGRVPLANVLVSLDMLVWTEGQQYGVSELKTALRKAGFEHVKRRKTVGYWSAVSGVKP
ncbi:MAG: 2-polyprenyl-3-methyl-5-hydroxy-6-metoxy-1,4-benzoquinol methylase [Planctomycetota bacterium]